MTGYLADLKHSARALSRRPGFSALVVATLTTPTWPESAF